MCHGARSAPTHTFPLRKGVLDLAGEIGSGPVPTLERAASAERSPGGAERSLGDADGVASSEVEAAVQRAEELVARKQAERAAREVLYPLG